MKTRFLWLVAATLPLLSGCTNANSESQPTNAVSPAPSVMALTNAPAPTNAPPVAVVPVVKPVNTELTPPETVKLSTSAGEIVRLAQSGVDSGVMLAYVTNSVHTFGLASEEIVYLNDLGVPSTVMTAMIQHDQQIREASLAGATVTSPATPAPNQTTWSAGTVGQPSNTWQEPAAKTAPVAQPEGVNLAPPPPPEELPGQVTVDHFYDSLSPYGTWVDIEGYGRCWRPTVVASDPGWRPYVHGGRWVWTDSGWYWYSDYSWGWAPFHYGRWFSHPGWGWCWMPGSVWGPAWVSWSYTDAYCGWAPLPPAACYSPGFGFTYYGGSYGSGFSFGLSWGCYTYVGYNNFCGRYYNQNCVPHHEAHRIHGNSTVVNNYINGDNNTIINQGIGTERVAAATRSEIHRTSVREVSTAGGPRGPRTGRNEILTPDGRTLAVTRNRVPGTQAVAQGGGTQPTAKVGAPNNSAPNSLAPVPNSRGETVRTAGQPLRGGGQGGGRPNARNPEISVAGVAPAASGASASPSRSGNSHGPRSESEKASGTAIASPPSTAPVNTAATKTSARTERVSPAPWLNNPRTPPQRSERGNTAQAATPTPPAPTAVAKGRSESSRDSSSSVVIIGSRNDRPPASSTPAPAPARPANTAATPWLKNPPVNTTTPAPNPPATWQSSGRHPQTGQPVRNAANPIRQPVPNYVASAAPSAPAAPVRAPSQPLPQPSAPRAERSLPQRTFSAPAPPQAAQPYSTPARVYTPAPAPVPRPSAPAMRPPMQSVAPRSSAPSHMSAPRPSAPAPSAPPSSAPSRSQPSSGGGQSRNGR